MDHHNAIVRLHIVWVNFALYLHLMICASSGSLMSDNRLCFTAVGNQKWSEVEILDEMPKLEIVFSKRILLSSTKKNSH